MTLLFVKFVNIGTVPHQTCNTDFEITKNGYLRSHDLPDARVPFPYQHYAKKQKKRTNTKIYGTTTVTNLSHKLQSYIYKSLYDDVIGELNDDIKFNAIIPLFSGFSIN